MRSLNRSLPAACGPGPGTGTGSASGSGSAAHKQTLPPHKQALPPHKHTPAPHKHAPPPEQLLQAFKSAALSLTNLYKTAAAEEAQARSAGFQEAVKELVRFLDRENLGLDDGEGWRVRQWATARLDGGRYGAAGDSGSDDDDDGGDGEGGPARGSSVGDRPRRNGQGQDQGPADGASRPDDRSTPMAPEPLVDGLALTSPVLCAAAPTALGSAAASTGSINYAVNTGINNVISTGISDVINTGINDLLNASSSVQAGGTNTSRPTATLAMPPPPPPFCFKSAIPSAADFDMQAADVGRRIDVLPRQGRAGRPTAGSPASRAVARQLSSIGSLGPGAGMRRKLQLADYFDINAGPKRGRHS